MNPTPPHNSVEKEKLMSLVRGAYHHGKADGALGLETAQESGWENAIAQALLSHGEEKRRSALEERDDVLATLKEVCEKMHLKEGSPNYELIKKGLGKCADYNFGGYSHAPPSK